MKQTVDVCLIQLVSFLKNGNLY
ncbi:hypothetical protein MUY_002311 [Bacillus licheniformis WX-02]|nr:hypothetical protein MUY_002311 [Bacillus licheniformis WX-02]